MKKAAATATAAAATAAEIARLRAELEALRQRQPKPTIKISAKGGISVYGLGRFPITLYPSQWNRLLQVEVTREILALSQRLLEETTE